MTVISCLNFLPTTWEREKVRHVCQDQPNQIYLTFILQVYKLENESNFKKDFLKFRNEKREQLSNKFVSRKMRNGNKKQETKTLSSKPLL